MAPPGLASGIVASFVKTSPEVLYLAFGRKAILSSTTMWEAILYPALLCWFIDKSLRFLFGWTAKNITEYQKLAAYPHLYSFTSTKSVVHWFQIIRTGAFQMFDDEVQAPLSVSNATKYYKVAKFPTRNIKTPIVLLYGGSDSLVDIGVMLKELPKHTVATEIPHYEHLDFLWAADVDRLVIPHVLESLELHAGNASKSKSSQSYKSPPLPSYSEAERASKLLRFNTNDSDEDADDDSDDIELRRVFRAGHSPHPALISQALPDIDTADLPAVPALGASPVASQITARSSLSRPEGWWSSDDPVTDSPASAPALNDHAAASAVDQAMLIGSAAPERVTEKALKRRSRMSGHGSQSSVGSANVSDRGIHVGPSKAVPAEGILSRDVAGSPIRHHDEGDGVNGKSPSKRGKRK